MQYYVFSLHDQTLKAVVMAASAPVPQSTNKNHNLTAVRSVSLANLAPRENTT